MFYEIALCTAVKVFFKLLNDYGIHFMRRRMSEAKNVYKVVLITTLQVQYLRILFVVTLWPTSTRMLINHNHALLSLVSSLITMFL